MHHIFRRQGLRSLSSRRRRTVSRDSASWSVNLTISPASRSSVQRAHPAGGFEQAVATSRASAFTLSLRSAPGRGILAQRPLQIASHEPLLGRVHCRAPNPHAVGDLLVGNPGVCRQQNLCPLQLACAVLAAGQKRSEFIALVLGESDTIAYVHLRLLIRG